MPFYWARFASYEGHLFRLDTRIYLEDVPRCKPTDHAVGAVVGKNPGSARPSTDSSELQAIALTNDKLLPTVRSFVRKSYQDAGVEVPPCGYVQVLNLFYLCDEKYSRAIRTLGRVAAPPTDQAEGRVFPWTMYLWGEFDDDKAQHISRFRNLNSNHHFYFDKNDDQLVSAIPGEGSFAKHTQGLKLAPVVTHLASLLQNG